MTEVKPNREQRRHPDKVQQPENEPLARDDQALQAEDERAQNRERSKPTADKWNQ